MEEQAGTAEHKRVIALAVDSSSHSENALQYYLMNIRKDGDFLVLIHVPEACDFSDAPSAPAAEKMMIDKRQEIVQLEQKYMDVIKGQEVDLKGKFRTHGGKPGEVICKLAEEEGASMIVCGTRGMGKIRRTIMGSVSDYIVHHAHVPVLVCKDK